MERMKRASIRKGVLHVETEHAIVNIRVGLRDAKGRSVEAVEIIPDGGRFAGEPGGLLDGWGHTRIVRDDAPAHPLPQAPTRALLHSEGRHVWSDSGQRNLSVWLWYGRTWRLDALTSEVSELRPRFASELGTAEVAP